MQAEVTSFAAGLEPAMQAVAPEAGIRFETICETPAFLARADDPAVLLAGRLAAAEATTLVAFGTEAGLFQKAGIPTVVCGPGHIAQAHQADEYVSLAQLAAGERFLQALIDAGTGGADRKARASIVPGATAPRPSHAGRSPERGCDRRAAPVLAREQRFQLGLQGLFPAALAAASKAFMVGRSSPGTARRTAPACRRSRR
jgi:hypothetical protein